MISPRVALASGAAGLAGAGLLLAGRLDGSVLVVLALLAVARAAPLATDPNERGPFLLARQARLVPAWIGVATAGILLAHSGSLADVRGANAVAGLAIARGDAAAVAAAWVALAAGAILIAALGVPSPREIRGRVEAVAAGGEILFVVTLFAGPQLNRWGDLPGWALGIAGVGGMVTLTRVLARAPARDLARVEWVPRAAAVLAAVAVGLALAGARL